MNARSQELLLRGDESYIEILEAARRLFLSQGYHGTSMRAIAREAGNRAVAGIYNHFPTKRAIFEALVERSSPHREVYAVLASIEAQTAPEFVREALRRVLPLVSQHYDFFQLAQIDFREFQGETFLHLFQTQGLPQATTILRRVQALPGLRPEEGIILMRFLSSVLIGYATTERLMPTIMFEQWSKDEWVEKFADLMIYGIAQELTK